MIKYFGLFLILICAFSLGFLFRKNMSMRIIILKSVKSMFQQFKTEISYSMPNLTEMMLSVTDSNICELTNRICNNLKSGLTPVESVELGLNNWKMVDIMSNEEKNLLISIISQIGTSDAENQILFLDNSIEKLDYHIENAIINNNKNSKVYFTVSIYVGIALVIILL